MQITIQQTGKQFALFAGKSRLSNKFKTAELAEAEYLEDKTTYDYWAQSAGVSIENTEAVVKRL